MSFEGDYTSLFESLKSIQCNQGKFKNFSDELLQTLTEIDKKELKVCEQVDDLSINKLDLCLNKKCEENASAVIFDGNESKNIYDKSVIKTFQSPNHKNITSNKFPYLKKGKGLSRFNYKICKGLKKKNLNATDSKNSVVIDNIATPVIPNEYQEKRNASFEKLEELVERESFCKGFKKKNLNATDSKNSVVIDNKATPVIPNEYQEKRNASFEKLEELVERESFCSTSSKVLRLLQESSFSNPVASPDRKLVSGKQATFFLVNDDNQTCSDKDIQAWKNVENSINNVDNTPLFTSSQIFISGILKKSNRSTIKNSSKISSPLAAKVKFLEQGVKILEYENEENITSCSDDTDLLSFSDFENLALINVDMNLNQEDLFTPKENHFSLIERNEKSQSISENSLNSKSLICRNKFEVNNKETFPQQNCTTVESLGEKSLKTLLLAKIYELDKEINIFKTKNKYLKESKKQEEKAVSEELENSFTSKNNYIVKSKLKNTGHCAQKDALSSEVSPQVKKKFINLEKEYKLLMKENPSLRMRKSHIKKINERETSIKKVNKCKIGIKQVNEFKAIKNVCGNPVSMQGHVSYQSQKMNIKPNVSSNITCPINSGKKARVRSVSENLKFCTTTTTTNSSLQKRSLIEQDSQKTDDLSLPKTKRENAGNAIPALEENPEIPLNSSGLPFELSYSSGENCQRTNMRDVLEDFVTKKDENIKPTTSRETSNDLLLIAKNKSSFDTDCSRDATESFKDISSNVKTNENQKMKVKQSEEIFSHMQDKTFNDLIEINDNIKSGLLTTGRENCNILTYPNGDKEFEYSDKKVYYYAINNSSRTSYINKGIEELKFANGQKEIYYSDGSYEVIFPDSSSKIVYEDGTEICIYQNGTKIQTNRDKTKIINFPNDQKEIYKNDSTWRVYPDGTTKILYKDGSEETRYRSGKICFKEVIKQSF
ncbi:UNVERIFIED_CONTAM: hypothetical protein RMT77_016320 [Armadillidium vulgare]